MCYFNPAISEICLFRIGKSGLRVLVANWALQFLAAVIPPNAGAAIVMGGNNNEPERRKKSWAQVKFQQFERLSFYVLLILFQARLPGMPAVK
ncbi:hypothetical protein [Methylomonas methanica]|uniref:hypothetical protein n=1 Tax=Methylomonas methanica TaxID=421 RepID=UPI0018D294A2|nr:hypothetical protein [Methylomonas methanica]